MCRMSLVTSGAAGRGQRLPHTCVSLCFTIRRKRNSLGVGVGFCREASADRKPPPQWLFLGDALCKAESPSGLRKDGFALKR